MKRFFLLGLLVGVIVALAPIPEVRGPLPSLLAQTYTTENKGNIPILPIGITTPLLVCAGGGTGCTTGAFTTSGVGTALELITGLSWTLPANTVTNIDFDCWLIYHQNAAAVSTSFGYQDATVAATNFAAQGMSQTAVTTWVNSVLVGSSTTTATAIITQTPSAITTNWTAHLHGFIEQPSNTSSSVFSIRVSTTTAADTVTIVRGSYCSVGL